MKLLSPRLNPYCGGLNDEMRVLGYILLPLQYGATRIVLVINHLGPHTIPKPLTQASEKELKFKAHRLQVWMVMNETTVVVINCATSK